MSILTTASIQQKNVELFEYDTVQIVEGFLVEQIILTFRQKTTRHAGDSSHY